MNKQKFDEIILTMAWASTYFLAIILLFLSITQPVLLPIGILSGMFALFFFITIVVISIKKEIQKAFFNITTVTILNRVMNDARFLKKKAKQKRGKNK